jgi:hypothetical protein
VRLSPLGSAATVGLLYHPQMMMSVEQSVECKLAGETEVPGENLPQFHFVHHKSHMTWPGLEIYWVTEQPLASQERLSSMAYGAACCSETLVIIYYFLECDVV